MQEICFLWKGHIFYIQDFHYWNRLECPYTFNSLPHQYKHSPTTAHIVLAKILWTVSIFLDIVVQGGSPETVGEAATVMCKALGEAEIEIPPES